MNSRLRIVEQQPRRLLGVVRVSKARDDMISPELQATAMRDYCAKHGHELVDLVEGIDESGSQRRSPWWSRLDQAIEAVEAGTYDGILVWKFSRVARHRLRWAVAVDRVESAGGVLLSATEAFDTSTSAGRFARGMTAEMNAFFAEMVGESFKETHERRVAAGLPHSGKPKFGYMYDRDAKVHRPDPETGPLLASIYRRFTAGESTAALADWMNSRNVRTTSGGMWDQRGLLRVLDNGFAAGFFRYRGELHSGVHEALITSEEWQAYEDARHRRRQGSPRRARSPYLLSGLVRCALCGTTMTAHTDHGWKGAGGHAYYRCRRANIQQCPAPYVRADLIEGQVLDYLTEVASDVDREAAALAAHTRLDAGSDVERERLEREALKVREALVRLASSHAVDPLPTEVYAEAKARLEGQAATVEASLESIGRSVRGRPRDVRANVAALLNGWTTEAVAVRRQILAGLIDCVLVRGSGRSSPVVVRVVDWWESRENDGL